jgi:sugar phosphate isomerase/epimerase
LKDVVENIVINTIAFKEMIDTGAKQWETFELVKLLKLSKIEIRREWIGDFKREIKKMALESEKQNLELFYSVPVPLFNEIGLARSEVLQCLAEAERMQAKLIKFTVGSFSGISSAGMAELSSILQNRNIVVTVENDQTLQNGKLKVLKNFMRYCQEYDVPIYCTYDIGNWCWVKEESASNADKLAEYVKYIHLKDVAWENNQPVVRFLDEGQLDWRTILKSLPQKLPLGIEYPCGSKPLAVLNRAIEKLAAIN